jgi:hypothetical protein
VTENGRRPTEPPPEGSEAERAYELGRQFAERVGRAPTLAEARFMRRFGRVPNRRERRRAENKG